MICLSLCIFWQKNKLTSLGFGELARCSKSLRSVNVNSNPIVAVSFGALHDLASLKSLYWDNTPSKCIFVQNFSVGQNMQCSCADGFANDPEFPTYCGWC
jgi:hypothetical protein